MRSGIAHAVLAQARRTPDAPAVVDGDHRLSYAELDAASAAIARGLRRAGVNPGQTVAVALPRSRELVCAMLGILRLGGTVLPLDRQSPPERQRHMLRDAAAVALIHGAEAPGDLPDGVRPLPVATLPETDSGPLLPEAAVTPLPEAAVTPLPEAADAAAIAFLFYTSGTTGEPKGVEVRHEGILRLARPGYIELTEGARYACLSNPAFDALSFEVWAPLLTGGCCVILDDRTVAAPRLLADALRTRRIDTMFITVALFNAVVDEVPECFAEVGQVLVGGEQLNARVIRRWYHHNPASPTQLYNVYGPTEATTFALCHPIPRDFAAEVVPIGRELPGTGTLLVVDGNRPAGPGEVAELYLSGTALAAGYRNLPGETAARFVRLPWLDGGAERYYRTGDLVRRDAAGLIEYVGRADRQVKVRGFRIEPGEVERRIATHPAIRQAYVCTRRDPVAGTNELLAYLVATDDLTFADFDRHLAATLPAYMRPHRLHLVAALPLNANGKVDQEALLRRDDPPWRGDDAPEVPVTDWQREVLDLAGEVLGVPDLRPTDRWIASGGDSIKALRLRFEVQRRWGGEIPATAVLDGDFAQLAAAIDTARGAAGSPYPVPGPPSGARSAPATSEQQRLWLLAQRSPTSTAYHVGLAFELRGRVDVEALRAALRRSVVRHPALRTAFAATGEGLRQVVADPYDPWVEHQPDGPDWRERARAFFAVPFDLAKPRMLRAHLLPRDDGGVLLLQLHHIAVDGWSLNVLFRTLSEDYARYTTRTGEPGDEAGPDLCAAEAVPEPSAAEAVPTPLDFAGWQAEWFGQPAYRARRAQLRSYYAEVDEVDAPLRPYRPRSGTGDRLLQTSIDTVGRGLLDRLGAELGLTRFHLLLALFGWAVYGVTGRTRPRVASPVANRPVRQFADSVGMFANTVLLPLAVTAREELRTQLLRQAAAIRPALDGQDVALADVVADHDFSDPLFDFLFVLDNTDFAALSLPGCVLRPVWLAPNEAKCPLTLSVIPHDAGFDCLWEYADDHFSAEEVAALAELFGRGLEALADGGRITLAELVRPYRSTLPEPGVGERVPADFTTVAEGFARQVGARPGATALVAGDRRLSYAELDAYAATLAAELAHRYPVGDDGDQHLALYFEPSIEHVVALLAAARLNLTVVPLDRAYPPALLRQILTQVDPLCVLLAPGDEAALDEIDAGRHPRLPVTLADNAAQFTQAAQVAARHLGRPLYTLFTSGSTGTPKGVRVSDAMLTNLLRWQYEAGGLAGPAATLQFSMLSFDVSFQEIFGTLCGGGTLHLPRPGRRQDMPALLEHLDAAGIERVFMPYVALQLLAEHAVRLGRYPSRLREVVTAGEQLICTDAIRRWFAGMPGTRLFNHYGPTETHVVSSLCLDGDPAAWPLRPAIGRPVANMWLRVVDDADEPVPPDCPGQLLIGGPLVAPCYLGDPALNAARFVELPGLGYFFRSGDRARFDRDGLLHFLGRDDQQIKLSGHRLELGQVEAALLRHPAVVNAVVVRDGEQLVAVLECRAEPPAPEELGAHLAGLLPAWVRVHRFRVSAQLPRTPSGKLDRRRALAAPGVELRPGSSAPAPAPTPLEARLTSLFEEVIGVPIGPDDRFFDRGVGSLGLMRFHLRCAAEGLPLTISDLFEHVTIRSLARFLAGPAATQQAAPARDETPQAAAPGADEPIAVVGMAVRLPGADDLAAFWSMVTTGGRGVEHFPAADGLVGARAQLSGPLAFDPERFGISRSDARLMDPQQRHLLMSCVEALAHAGIADAGGRRIGLLASCGENTYFQEMLRSGDPTRLPDTFQLALHHEKDFLATKVAYHLGLTGPAFTVQAACASSLVAVHVAAGLLRAGESEVMLVGGVLVDPTLRDGYRYRAQHIFSPDGHCRPFSDDAAGTIGGSGVAVVVLKPLRAARRDGDTVYAVITGSAVNNDGAEKLGYSAPSVAGQREVIRAALRRSGRRSAELGYVEAHGTGTELGDPVEVAALRQAYDLADSGRCALASVKSQIGHLGAAAGVVGLVRAVLAVHHGIIPPNVDFRRLNPRLGSDPTPFYIPTEARPWPNGRPRVAAVSSFGIGGANAHLILEAAGEPGPADAVPPRTEMSAREAPVLVLSAHSATALRADADRIADYLAARPENYHRVLRHLRNGRPAGRWRMTATCPDAETAVAWLRSATGVEVPPGTPSAAPDAAPAPAPWDLPPPAFDLAEYDFVRAAPAFSTAKDDDPPVRRPETEWLYQPHWVRSRDAGDAAPGRRAATLVLLTAAPVPENAVRSFVATHRRVVTVHVGDGFARLAPDRFQVEPGDPDALRRLLDAVTDEDAEVDWVHALPLAVAGPVDERSVAVAYRACVDTPAALLAAVAALPRRPRLRIWWLSYGAQPVTDEVHRPELSLLAGVWAVAPQETGVVGHWVDLPSPDPADWAPQLAALLADPVDQAPHPAADPADQAPRRLALRQGYWWEPTLLPVRPPAGPAPAPGPGEAPVYLILGGTGGIGRSLAAGLLARGDCRLLLLARDGRLPTELARWADRITLVEADLATTDPETVACRIDAARIDGIVHAAGVAAGGLITRRNAAAMRTATAARVAGALLVERLIERYRPGFAVYCSSMSVEFGGVGQLDYAATNALLDGFARYRPDGTAGTRRIAIDWDVWREVGLARDALPTDSRHRAHLAVGLTTEEGQRLFAHALRLRLPQLMVCTTALDRAREFYAPPGATTAEGTRPAPAAAPLADAAEQLSGWLCRWLEVDRLEPEESLTDLGADSLLLLNLIDEVKERYGVNLALSRLSHRVSLREVLGLIDEALRVEGAAPVEVPVEVWQTGTGDELLCLIHPIGGDIGAYRPLVSALDPTLTVCLIADPGLREPAGPAWSVPERAARYHAALRARFPEDRWRWRLGGWSFGAWVALAMAAEAERTGRPVAELYLLDPPPPDAGATFRGYDDTTLEALFAHELGAAATQPSTAATAYAAALARCCRANLASMTRYAPPALTATPARLWLASRPATGLPDREAPQDQARRWHSLLPGLRGWCSVDTTHYGIVGAESARSVADIINEAVR